ncbi:MAG: hypothetical protein E7584_01390 [Ruminococcaceae bacterium]|nr:hypothetical protein [Oscillospiraceae bacterium]
MKKIFAALLCILLLCNFVSCNQSNPAKTTESTSEPTVGAPDEKGTTPPVTLPQETTQPQTESTTAPTHQECPSTKYPFLAEEEQQAWKPYLLNTLANIAIKDSEHYIPGSYAVGLMDINFDNVPEVLAASAGGSMGNVFIEIYDLYTGKEIDFYNAAHWQEWDNIYLCVVNKNGEKSILTEGSYRNPELGWIKHFSLLSYESNNGVSFTPLFSESVAQEVGYYKCNGQTVTKEEYDTQFQQFLKNYQTISQTQIQLIKWKQFDAASREELNEKIADALIGSTQEFVYTCTENEK